MPALGPIVLQGAHIALEPLLPEHAPALHAATAGDEMWSWMSFDLRDRAQLERWMTLAFAARDRGEEVPFVVVLRATGEVVGSTRYMDIRAMYRGVEIGWTWYRRDVWGGPVNPEAKYLLMRHAFEDWGAIRVCLKTDVKNVHSQNAIKKLGARYEGTLRNHYIRRDGSFRDSVYFSVIESEWPEVKRRLEDRISTFVRFSA
jgi:RimJ/RimL family protein N-acetyltransferase